MMVNRQRGFTLIEMLATIALIAIAMSGVAVFFSNNGPEQQLKKNIEQFVLYADHATDFAMVKGETWGLVITPPKWRKQPLEMGWLFKWQRLVIEYDDDFNEVNQTWQDIENLPEIDVPRGVEIAITIDEVLLKWEDKAPKENVPQILLYSGGEKTDFEIELIIDEGYGEPQHIEIDEWGSIVWRQQEELRKEIAQLSQ